MIQLRIARTARAGSNALSGWLDNMVLYLPTPTRRAFLTSAAAFAASTVLPVSGLRNVRAASVKEFRLKAAPGRTHLVPEPYGETPVWAYNGAVPDPEIRVCQGERLRVVVDNGLDEETTVHWHGMRTPNAMDGAPHLTQAPVAPDESFTYQFDAVDAGAFWYHLHQNSTVQVGRGLYGPPIIEETEPVRVDRELTWILDDWRLTQSATISDNFGNRHDLMHNGRVGNTVTINDRVPESIAVRTGERVRVRLINAANARIFGLGFAGLEPIVIALDGQPVAPHVPTDGRIWFINGKAATGHVTDPLLTLPRDRTCVRTMTNATAWHHPIHLHGHTFLEIAGQRGGGQEGRRRRSHPGRLAAGRSAPSDRRCAAGNACHVHPPLRRQLFHHHRRRAGNALLGEDIRLKIDNVETGLPAGVPVILGAGMGGDRFSVTFCSLAALDHLATERCEAR